jgi:hypothetical protein
MIVSARVLNGQPYETAKKFGMPHIGAHYLREDVRTNKLDENALCCICGKMATNSHHDPEKGMGGKNSSWCMKTEHGMFILMPSLKAVCGSGTTGCHNGFHGGARYKSRWEWDSDELETKWWSGYLLSHGVTPHSPQLYGMGRWVITDALTGEEIEIRG